MNVAFGLVKSTALYVFLSLPVCIWGFGVAFADIKSAVEKPTSFTDWFLVAGFWALPALVVIVALNAVFIFVKYRVFRKQSSAGVLQSVVGGLFYAFRNPYHGLILVWFGRDPGLTSGQRFMSRGYSVVHFFWAIALIAYLAAGFVAVS